MRKLRLEEDEIKLRFGSPNLNEQIMSMGLSSESQTWSTAYSSVPELILNFQCPSMRIVFQYSCLKKFCQCLLFFYKTQKLQSQKHSRATSTDDYNYTESPLNIINRFLETATLSKTTYNKTNFFVFNITIKTTLNKVTLFKNPLYTILLKATVSKNYRQC